MASWEGYNSEQQSLSWQYMSTISAKQVDTAANQLFVLFFQKLILRAKVRRFRKKKKKELKTKRQIIYKKLLRFERQFYFSDV